MKSKKNTPKQNEDFALQPILFTQEQYKELLKAVSMYTLVKQSGVLPYTDPQRLYASILDQGKKFDFYRKKMSQMEWFEKINDDVFNDLFEYTEEEMWPSLAHMLAHRDVADELGDAVGLSEEELPPDMFFDAMGNKILAYLKEFEKNGIKNMSVVCRGARKSMLDIKPE